MPKMLIEKVVIVTGAGRGIGRDIALLAAAQNAQVVVNDLGGSERGDGSNSAPADEVAEEIKQAGGQAVANFDNVADPAGAQRIVEAAMDSFGQLDGVVNNAGILRDVIFHKMTDDDWDSVMAVHLKGSFNVSRAAAPHFRKQIAGAFVHMTSTSGLIGNFGQANYAAAKLGDRRPVEIDRARHVPFRSALELHSPLRVEPSHRHYPHRQSRGGSASGEDQAHDA